MNIKSTTMKVLQKNRILKNLVIKIFNKIKLESNSLDVVSIHFIKNYVKFQGKDNKFKCMGQSFLQCCHIYMVGEKNIIEISDDTQIYGNNSQVFYINGNNNRIVVGRKCIIRNTTFFIKGNNNIIELGDNVSAFGAEFHIEQDGNCLSIGNGVTFHGRNGYPVHIALDEGSRIFIDEDCMLSNGIQIRSTDSHSIVDLDGKRLNPAKNITIGKHTWIGLGCTILKGVEIAPHTVVAAGSICTSSFRQENCVLAGNPAKVVKQNVDWDRKFV